MSIPIDRWPACRCPYQFPHLAVLNQDALGIPKLEIDADLAHALDDRLAASAEPPPRLDAVIEVDAAQDKPRVRRDAEGIAQRGPVRIPQPRLAKIYEFGQGQREYLVAQGPDAP